MAERDRSITIRVLEHIQKRPGQYLYSKDMASELKLEEAQIKRSLNYIMSTNKLPKIEKKTQFGPWIYRPIEDVEQNGNPIFEMKLKTKKGDLIIEGEDGTLYRAVELE